MCAYHSIIATPWTIACQVPLSMVFFRKEYWSGLLFSSPGHLLDPGIEPRSPTLQVDYLPSELQGKPSVYSYANSMAISTLQGWNEVCIINPKEWIHLDHLVYTVVTVWLSVQFSLSVMSNSLRPHEQQHTSLSITSSWSSLRLTSIESVMPSSHLILCRPHFFLP